MKASDLLLNVGDWIWLGVKLLGKERIFHAVPFINDDEIVEKKDRSFDRPAIILAIGWPFLRVGSSCECENCININDYDNWKKLTPDVIPQKLKDMWKKSD